MQQVRKIREELYASNGRDGIWWLGNAGFAIRLGECYVFIDPVVTEWVDNPIASDGRTLLGSVKQRLHDFPLEAKEVERADQVLYTHDHSDHLDRGFFRKLTELKADVWAPEECQKSIVEGGIPQDHFHVARCSRNFNGHGYSVEITRGRHASVGESCGLELKWYYENVRDQDTCSCGYLLKTRYGNIFHPGDTYYLPEFLKLKVDFLLLPINDTNMGVGFAALLTQALQPRIVIPCHYGMYGPLTFWRGGHPAEYLSVLAARDYWSSLSRTDIMVLRPGGRVVLG